MVWAKLSHIDCVSSDGISSVFADLLYFVFSVDAQSVWTIAP